MSFTTWYRSTLNRDGRVVWWEHVYAFALIPLIVGLFLTRYFQTFWPALISLVLGVGFGLWSWRQDLIVHNTDNPDNNTVRDEAAKVPLLTKFYLVVILAEAGWIISQWIRFGRY